MRVLYGSNPFQISKDFRNEYKINNKSFKHMTLTIASFTYWYSYETEALEIINTLYSVESINSNEGLNTEHGRKNGLHASVLWLLQHS